MHHPRTLLLLFFAHTHCYMLHVHLQTLQWTTSQIVSSNLLGYEVRWSGFGIGGWSSVRHKEYWGSSEHLPHRVFWLDVLLSDSMLPWWHDIQEVNFMLGHGMDPCHCLAVIGAPKGLSWQFMKYNCIITNWLVHVFTPCCLSWHRVDSIMLVENGFKMTSTDASDKMLKQALKIRWQRRKEEAFDQWGEH